MTEKLQLVEDIIKRVVATGFVKNSMPLSSLIVAPVGGGKTTTLQKFIRNKNIFALSDVTPYGLTKLLPEIKANDVRHLIIFDLVEPMSRNKSTVNNFIGFMNSLIEEGIFRISTGFIDVKEPIQLGLITCTTDHELRDKRRGWHGIGFISRLLPVSFTYSKADVIRILQKISEQGIESIQYEKLKALKKNIRLDPEISKQLIPYAQAIDGDSGSMPFRRQKQLMTLLMGNALLRGSDIVEKTDFEWFQSVANYINFDLNPL